MATMEIDVISCNPFCWHILHQQQWVLGGISPS